MEGILGAVIGEIHGRVLDKKQGYKTDYIETERQKSSYMDGDNHIL